MDKRKIFISTGEISGDLYGSNLVTALLNEDRNLEFWGIGHTKLKAVGVNIIADLATASTIGIFEPLKYLPRIIYTFFKVKSFFKNNRPSLVILIDNQGFHMQVAKVAKKLRIPVVYYIAPQEWLWGTDRAGLKVINNTDLILAIFKDEADFYKRLKGNVSFTGHPLVDIVKSQFTKNDFYRKYDIKEEKRILSIFPGSRWQEINKTFPVLLEAAIELVKKHSDLQIFVSVSSEKFRARIEELVKSTGLKTAIFYSDNIYDLIKNTYLSLTVSGTITVEHALLGTPALVGYRFNKISFWLIMFLLRKKLSRIGFMALTNIIFKKEVLPEFMQDKCTVENLVSVADHLLGDQNAYLQLKDELSGIRTFMGNEGSVNQSVKSILQLLNRE